MIRKSVYAKHLVGRKDEIIDIAYKLSVEIGNNFDLYIKNKNKLKDLIRSYMFGPYIKNKKKLKNLIKFYGPVYEENYLKILNEIYHTIFPRLLYPIKCGNIFVFWDCSPLMEKVPLFENLMDITRLEFNQSCLALRTKCFVSGPIEKVVKVVFERISKRWGNLLESSLESDLEYEDVDAVFYEDFIKIKDYSYIKFTNEFRNKINYVAKKAKDQLKSTVCIDNSDYKKTLEMLDYIYYKNITNENKLKYNILRSNLLYATNNGGKSDDGKDKIEIVGQNRLPTFYENPGGIFYIFGNEGRVVNKFIKQQCIYSMAITKNNTFITSTGSQVSLKFSVHKYLLSLYKIFNDKITLLHEHKTPHAFKQLSFLTSGTLLALTTKGDLYTIAIEKNKKNKETTVKGIYKQTLKNKVGEPLSVNCFAHDTLNPTEVILVGGTECKPAFYYVNMKNRRKKGAIRMTDISDAFLIQGPEKVWLHDGKLGIVYGKGANLDNKDHRLGKLPIAYQKVLIGEFNCVNSKKVIELFGKTRGNTNHSNRLLPST